MGDKYYYNQKKARVAILISRQSRLRAKRKVIRVYRWMLQNDKVINLPRRQNNP